MQHMRGGAAPIRQLPQAGGRALLQPLPCQQQGQRQLQKRLPPRLPLNQQQHGKQQQQHLLQQQQDREPEQKQRVQSQLQQRLAGRRILGGGEAPRRGILMRGVAAAAVALSGAAAVPAGWHPSSAQAVSLAEVTPTVAPAQLTPREQALISIFERTNLSVVNIFDATIPGRGSGGNVEVPEGNGTGFVLDGDGNIVTNYHVLQNILNGLGDKATGKKVARVTILMQDGSKQTFDGILVGTDKARDLAVVRVNAPPEALRPLPLSSLARPRVGQQVLAIGNPYGFDHTLTTGVVSGVDREIRSQVGTLIPGGIQTDAAINPGNSGGPLLDSAGNLIGVNTAIFTNTGASVGIGFALPIDVVARVVPQLIQNGRVVRASLNAQVASDEIARRLQVAQGACLQVLTPGGAAEKAGLLATRRSLSGIVPGDSVQSVGPTLVYTGADLLNSLDQYQPGDVVKLKVLRYGEATESGTAELEISVTLGKE